MRLPSIIFANADGKISYCEKDDYYPFKLKLIFNDSDVYIDYIDMDDMDCLDGKDYTKHWKKFINELLNEE